MLLDCNGGSIEDDQSEDQMQLQAWSVLGRRSCSAVTFPGVQGKGLLSYLLLVSSQVNISQFSLEELHQHTSRRVIQLSPQPSARLSDWMFCQFFAIHTLLKYSSVCKGWSFVSSVKFFSPEWRKDFFPSKIHTLKWRYTQMSSLSFLFNKTKWNTRPFLMDACCLLQCSGF